MKPGRNPGRNPAGRNPGCGLGCAITAGVPFNAETKSHGLSFWTLASSAFAGLSSLASLIFSAFFFVLFNLSNLLFSLGLLIRCFAVIVVMIVAMFRTLVVMVMMMGRRGLIQV